MSTQINSLIERVEQLLLRYEELKRAHHLLVADLTLITAERDSLKSRLLAARARIDTLIDRLPSTTVVSSEMPLSSPDVDLGGQS